MTGFYAHSFQPVPYGGHPIPNCRHPTASRPRNASEQTPKLGDEWIPWACLMPSESLQSLGGSCAPKELPSHAVFRVAPPLPDPGVTVFHFDVHVPRMGPDQS